MAFSDTLQRFGRSPAFKFLVISFLILSLMIPLLFVWALASERSSYANSAFSNVSRMWSGSQVIRGPAIIVPVRKNKIVKQYGKEVLTWTTKYAILLPEDLDVSAKIDTKELKRGIFDIPVYRSTIRFSGRFSTPDLQRIERNSDEIIWADAVFATVISDVRGIKKTAALTLDGTSQRFKPGVGAGIRGTKGIHIPITEEQAKSGFSFDFTLDLNGSQSIGFVPAGGETRLAVSSNWPHPSFDGSFLPDTRNISESGFEAKWSITKLARGEEQSFVVTNTKTLMQGTVFNVKFYQPVDYYNLVDRSLKYALGFIAIIFLAVFVMEILSRKRVHWIQYVFVGLALIIFYLVLLGLSEHLGFEIAYALASFLTTVLVGVYGRSAFQSSGKGLTIFCVLAGIYGLLYLLLRVEDYAMLIGSLAAFTLLAIVMYTTRNVDWGSAAGSETSPSN